MCQSSLIQGSSFILRPPRDSDADDIVAGAGNHNVWRTMGHQIPHPYHRADAETWLALCRNDPTHAHVRMIEADGHAIGCIGFFIGEGVHQRTATMGYWLAEEYWGRNIMTEAVALMLRYAFSRDIVERVQASVHAWNPSSQRVLEKNGFTREGSLRRNIFKDGNFTDEVRFGLLRSEFEVKSPED